jgi:hypothetical protein
MREKNKKGSENTLLQFHSSINYRHEQCDLTLAKKSGETTPAPAAVVRSTSIAA